MMQGNSIKCFECGSIAQEYHHIIPRSLGGLKTVPLCGNCHARVHGLDGKRRDSHSFLTKRGLFKRRWLNDDDGKLVFSGILYFAIIQNMFPDELMMMFGKEKTIKKFIERVFEELAFDENSDFILQYLNYNPNDPHRHA